MLKTASAAFAVFFLVVGFGGFVPALTPHGLLFGIFAVGRVHNVMHVACGAAALLCARGAEEEARKYFQLLGAVYALVALVGFFYGDHQLLGIIQHNRADIGLHIAIAFVAWSLGFGIDPLLSADEDSQYI